MAILEILRPTKSQRYEMRSLSDDNCVNVFEVKNDDAYDRPNINTPPPPLPTSVKR